MKGPRNFGPKPYLQQEGRFVKPLNTPEGASSRPNWHRGLNVYDRLNCHHTLASARRFVHYKALPGIIPSDSLDMALDADFDQGMAFFPDSIDVIIHRSTTGVDNRRRLRNVVILPKAFDAIGAAADLVESEESMHRKPNGDTIYVTGGHGGTITKWQYPANQYGRYDRVDVKTDGYSDLSSALQFHPLYVSGIKERHHPSSSKLMNSSHHSAQTNAGYSRQDSDGNAYQY